MRDSEYRLDIVAETSSMVNIKHIKYREHKFNVNATEKIYSFTDNSSFTLHTFKITSTDKVIVNNLREFHNGVEGGIVIYEAKVNGLSVNSEIEKIKTQSRNQRICNFELAKIPFKPITLNTEDLLVLRFTIEWSNFKRFDTDFESILGS
jgi:hypothetical protein